MKIFSDLHPIFSDLRLWSGGQLKVFQIYMAGIESRLQNAVDDIFKYLLLSIKAEEND